MKCMSCPLSFLRNERSHGSINRRLDSIESIKINIELSRNHCVFSLSEKKNSVYLFLTFDKISKVEEASGCVLLFTADKILGLVMDERTKRLLMTIRNIHLFYIQAPLSEIVLDDVSLILNPPKSDRLFIK